jgi:thymidylate synthase (FAD)
MAITNDEGTVEYLDHMGSDLTVANAARVSFNKQISVMSENDERLIKYLADHNHVSPFFHPQISIRIMCPISIRNQLDKSRIGLAINEVSRRYVSTTPPVFFPSWRSKPSGSIKQGSGSMISNPDVLVSVDMMYREAVATCLTTYEHLIAQGVAPEQARFVLPLGTMTEFIWTGSLAAYARVFQLRTSPDAQQECRTIAYKIGAIVARHFPISWAALVQRSIA